MSDGKTFTNFLSFAVFLGFLFFYGGGLSLLSPRPLAAATVPARKGPLNDLIKAAAKERQFTFVGGARHSKNEMWKEIEKGINSRYGIEVELRGLPGPVSSALTPRLISEVKAGQRPTVDMMPFTPIQLDLMERAEAIKLIDWRQYSPEVKPRDIIENKLGLLIAADLYGIGYNTDIVKPQDLPQKLESILEPKYNGMIGVTPYAAGWGTYGAVLGMQRTMDVATKLVKSKNLAGMLNCGNNDRVTSGEFPLFVFTCDYAGSRNLQKTRAPIARADIEGVAAGYSYTAAVVKNAQHPNLATLIAIFLATVEGQRILWKYSDQDSHLIEGSQIHKVVQELKSRGVKAFIHTITDIKANPAPWTELEPAVGRLFSEPQKPDR
jgi:iron(III) transport system substrate-binding protein